jgi:flagellum-specific peptidoglycan hydrolase FlgJ
MKRILISFSILFASQSGFTQSIVNTSLELSYIVRYKALAILEMKIFRIPASITLAQGLVESGAGTSELAIKANNHFGIKCKEDWFGETYLHTDDLKDECFRKYPSTSESFRDHSVFLAQRKRYDFLFVYSITDYKSWAKGLSAAKYATDINYAKKLVAMIELYNLSVLDK